MVDVRMKPETTKQKQAPSFYVRMNKMSATNMETGETYTELFRRSIHSLSFTDNERRVELNARAHLVANGHTSIVIQYEEAS